mgnify:CR=1 FL=1
MTAFAVRVAGAADEAAVARVLRDSYPALMAAAYPPELLERALPAITRPHPRLLASGAYYLCEAEGEPVGCGGWSFERPDSRETEPGVAHIRHFATRAGWAGRGVGRALYRRCEEEARAAGVRTFECQSSLNGERFYAAMGFVRIRPVAFAMGPVAFPGILMRRSL